MKYLQIYPDKAESLLLMSDEAAGAIIKAAIVYQESGKESDLPAEARPMWPMYRAMIDSSIELYEKRSSAGRNGGIVSGESRRSNSKQNEANSKQNEANAKQNEANRSKREANRSKREANRSKREANANQKEEKKKRRKEENISLSLTPSLTPYDEEPETEPEREERENEQDPYEGNGELEVYLNNNGVNGELLDILLDTDLVRTLSDALRVKSIKDTFGRETVLKAAQKAKENGARSVAYLETCCKHGITELPVKREKRVLEQQYSQREGVTPLGTSEELVESYLKDNPEEVQT